MPKPNTSSATAIATTPISKPPTKPRAPGCHFDISSTKTLSVVMLFLFVNCQKEHGQEAILVPANAQLASAMRDTLRNHNTDNAEQLNAAWPQHGQQTGDSSSPQIDINYLAKSRGFAIESHKVITKDQYILVAHRLINPRWSSDGQKARGLVILQHGILCASPLFLMNSSPLDRPSGQSNHHYHHHRQQQQQSTNEGFSSNFSSFHEAETGKSNSLAIALSNRGYDVWLTNFRGTQYSHGHLRKRGPDYWKFNVDNLIEYDLGAYVGYILKLTKRKQYAYIGHSLGATVGLGSLLVHSQTPVIDRLSCSILMAPVASTQFMRGSLIPLFKLATLLYGDPAPFPGPTATLAAFIRQICMIVPRLCSWMANMVIGAKQGEKANLLTALPGFSPFASTLNRHQPQGTASGNLSSNDDHHSVDRGPQSQEDALFLMMHQSISIQLLKHIVQVHSTGKLSRFSYGAQGNKLVYGKQAAPTYDLAQINEPHLRVALVSGLSDAISTPDEVNWIAAQIGNKVGHLERITIPANPFNHMDLVMSKDAYRLVNRRVIEFIERNKCFS